MAGKMVTKNRLPPIHPGEILREEFLSPLGMSANELALALRVPATRINDIVRCCPGPRECPARSRCKASSRLRY
jgi:hypothetical protein